tara:strand:+ start:576 stop:1904 length:1329 start_codon:yes stop_codon:yes gene_type:complete
MPTSITMPALSPTMTEGNLARWLKAEGDSVNAGDPIAEIETDKAMMEVEAVCDGVLGRILVPDGTENVEVNTIIGVMLLDGEDSSDLNNVDDGSSKGKVTSDQSDSQGEWTDVDTKDIADELTDQASSNTVQSSPPTSSQPLIDSETDRIGERVMASPLARRMAEQTNIDLKSIEGSGPGGRIVKVDIEAIQAQMSVQTADRIEDSHTDKPRHDADGVKEIRLSNMRKVIAKRLTESKQSIPHFYMTVECEIDQLLSYRKKLNARRTEHDLTINDFVVKAAALALQEVPEANCTWNEQSIVRYDNIDIAVAVSLEEGLITPIVRDANKKGLSRISAEVRDMAGRGREGKLMPNEYQGGTLTISNLGMHGVREFVAIINPPQSAILAVGSGEQRAIVKDGALAIATTINVTLSADHRVVDGTTGAKLLGAFRSLVEDPLTMLL